MQTKPRKRITKEDETRIAINMANQWVKSSHWSLGCGYKPASLTDTTTAMHIEGVAEEIGIDSDLSISRPAYERIRAKAKHHASWKLNSGEWENVKTYFVNLKK
jgi:hypothetical protein